MNPSRDLPGLTPDNHRETSPKDSKYNCIAWAAGDTENWWQPGVYWRPADWPANDCGLGTLEAAFQLLGYQDCGMDWSLVPGFTKVALYGTGSSLYTHAARQLLSGKWTSKLGSKEDIEHDTPDVVANGVYGEVMQIMKRPI